MVNSAGTLIEKLNRAQYPEDNFQFDLEDMGGAQASWHTHPETSGNLSIADYWFFVQWPDMVHFVISKDDLRCYGIIGQSVRIIDEDEDYTAWILERSLPAPD